MFSGIIASRGEVTRTQRTRQGIVLTIRSAFRRLVLGESIAVNGVCLTVTSARGGTFSADVSAESLRRTTLDALARGASVNLERSLRLGDRLGGHLVFGHVDGIGRVRTIRPEGTSARYEFSMPAALAPLVAEKGSIAVDGVSLTVCGCGTRAFEVAVIPHTAAVTTLGRRRPGDRVNLEVDMLARYVARAVALVPRARPRTSGRPRASRSRTPSRM